MPMPMPIEQETGRLVCTSRLDNDELCRDAQALCEVKVMLEGYQMAVKMLRLCREDKRSRATDAAESGLDVTYYGAVGGDEAYWLAKLQRVRSFVESLPNRSCKMMLYYHYIRGLTVERTAEELDISRRGAFRLKKKALAFAATAWQAAKASEDGDGQAHSCS